jgi:nucleoside-diphosphate-sugar epimerase
MKVFITGATGYLGSAIACRLVKAGLRVHGLARSAARAESLRSIGVTPILGTLEQPESYLADLKNCDAVVHAARASGDLVAIDQKVLEAIRVSALDGRVRHVLYTSGAFVHGPAGDAGQDETATLNPSPSSQWRPAHEDVALDLVDHDVHVSILRPGLVYGGQGGYFGGWFREGLQRKTVTYPGEGSQHWSVVHRDDVAEAYRLALEHARGGQKFLLVDGSRHTARELAQAAAHATGAITCSLAPEQVLEQLGDRGAALLMDHWLTAAKARRDLGWVPRHTSFVAEAEALYREWQDGRRATVS